MGQDADPLRLAEGQDGRLDLAIEQVVAGLQRLEGSRRPGGLHLRHVEVGDADVAHLPLARQIVEGRHRLVDGVAGVPGVGLQQIDVLRAEMRAGSARWPRRYGHD